MKELLGPSVWIDVNSQRIWDALSGYHTLAVEERRLMDLGIGNLLHRLELRTLSEMPICRAHTDIFYKIGTPYGFRPVNGSVNSDTELLGTREKFHHSFLVKITPDKIPDEIMDFTAAQFIIEGQKPGDRAGQLKNAAPELVRVFSNGLTVLSGNSTEILERLGLEYNVNQPYHKKL